MPRPTKEAVAKRGATVHIRGIPLWVKQALTRMEIEDKTAEQIMVQELHRLSELAADD